MSTFETFDWDSEFASNRWKEFQRNTDVPYGMDEQDVLFRLKLKYYKKYIDSTYDPYAKIRNPTSSSTTSPNTTQRTAQNTESNSTYNTNNFSNQQYQTPSTSQINPMEMVWIFFQFTTLIFAFLYFIPLFGDSYTNYSRSLFSAFAAHGLSMYKTIGRFRFDKETLARISTNESFQYVLIYGLLASYPPISFVLFPVIIYSLFHIANHWNTHSNFFPEPLKRFHRNFVEQNIRKLLSNQTRAQIWAAQIEVISMFVLLFTAFIGSGSFLLTICYYWFLSFRYITNYNTRVLCDALGAKLDGIFYSPTCPPFIKNIYVSIRSYMRRSVEARTTRQ